MAYFLKIHLSKISATIKLVCDEKNIHERTKPILTYMTKWPRRFKLRFFSSLLFETYLKFLELIEWRPNYEFWILEILIAKGSSPLECDPNASRYDRGRDKIYNLSIDSTLFFSFSSFRTKKKELKWNCDSALTSSWSYLLISMELITKSWRFPNADAIK